MNQYIKLFENWNRPQVIKLVSPRGVITIKVSHGKIDSIINRSGIQFPFRENQIVDVFMRQWANQNGFKWQEEEQDKKIFGIKTSDIPKSDPLRRLYPNRFRD